MTQGKKIRMTLAATFLALATVSIGCGGGGGGTSSGSAAPAPDPVAVVEAVVWNPPTTFFDNTPLNPQTDLAYYEIYVGTSPNFTDNDAPIAAIASVTSETSADGMSISRVATHQFNLTHLVPFVEQGTVYYVSVRAVGTDNLVSSFSTPVEWILG
jgi:hypothetical protein